MFELQILIPVADNDGNSFGEKDLRAFEAFVMTRFGGITLYPNTAVGSWVDGGRVYNDATLVYGIAVPSIAAGNLVGEVVEYAKTAFRQEAIFIRYLGVVEII